MNFSGLSSQAIMTLARDIKTKMDKKNVSIRF